MGFILPLIMAIGSHIAQNVDNKTALKNQENQASAARGYTADAQKAAISGIDQLYKNNPNPMNGLKAPTGPQQYGGGHIGGGIMGQGGQMQAPPAAQRPGGQQGGLEQMLAQFLQGQTGGQTGNLEQRMAGGQRGGAPGGEQGIAGLIAALQKMMPPGRPPQPNQQQESLPLPVAPPQSPPNPFGNPPLRRHPMLDDMGGDGSGSLPPFMRRTM